VPRLRLLLVVALLLLWLPAGPAAAQTQQWQLVASDDFGGGSLAPHWSAYQGNPPCCRATIWQTSQVAEQAGRLVITAQRNAQGQWITGGVSAANWPAAVRTYGKYVARVRIDQGAGISAVALLWPVAKVWPPEIDYYELSDQDGARDQEAATTHRAGDNAQIHNPYQGDLTQWHVVSVEWLPDSITYFVDNKVIGKVTDPSYIPHQPMWPAFQMQIQQSANGNQTATATAPVHMYVDAFDVYAPVDATPSATPSTTPSSPATSSPPPTSVSPPGNPSTSPTSNNPGTSNTASSSGNPGNWLWIAIALGVLVLLIAVLVIWRVRRRFR
jgi:beta-glucanase (GH16 family)